MYVFVFKLEHFINKENKFLSVSFCMVFTLSIVPDSQNVDMLLIYDTATKDNIGSKTLIYCM